MHGIVNRGLQIYVTTIFGEHAWEDICTRAGLSFFHFETMLVYEDALTEALIEAASAQLGRSRDEFLEDFGTFIVAEKGIGAVRELLRFGGEDYVAFLHSLEDMHHIAAIALPGFELPRFELEPRGEGHFELSYRFAKPGYGAFFLGLMRAMADDYGALVIIERAPAREDGWDRDTFTVQVLHQGWPEAAAGRDLMELAG